MTMFEAFKPNDYDNDGFRTCDTTGLTVHRSAETMVKVHGLTAVVALLIGGTFALLVALTRWELIGLLSAPDYYKFLSIHAWNLLIFWMVFMEIAILYVGGPFVLGRRLALPRIAWVGYAIMLVGAVWINIAIWITKQPNQQPLLTSYAPLPSSPAFYAGVIVFILGTVIAALPFFAVIWRERVDNPGRTLPLVTFGAFVAGIIAVESLVGGLITFVPTFLWRIGWLAHIDAAWYRQMYWLIGHGTQQINLVAMITVWYFMTHLIGKAEVASEKVSRFAFVLYLFFINIGAAHHLMADPGASMGWKLWNTSYAAYGAVIASMIHAFAIPAGLEVGRRAKNLGSGTFGWLWTAPWRDPGFSATILSIVLFGFLGGITGVMNGQMQLNITWHNTLGVPGHFHGTVAAGTTLAFMGLAFYVVKLVFRKEWVGGMLATTQPYVYGFGMGIVSLMMMYLGVLFGVPRRHPSVMDIPGTDFSFVAARPLFAIFGIGALIAVTGGIVFLLVAVVSLLFGDEYRGPGPDDPSAVADGGEPEEATGSRFQSMRGTFAFTGVFFAVFVLMWALNWFLLANLWNIG